MNNAAPKQTARKKAKAEQPALPVIERGFKGYTKDFACTGGASPFQYEVGKTYEEPEASLCQKGFHYCKHPLDTWNYYPPIDGNRYSEVSAGLSGEAPLTEPNGDSKRVTRKLTIGAELSRESLIRAAVKSVQESATSKKESPEESCATFGDWAHAATSGYEAHAATTGYGAHAASLGYCGKAAVEGEHAVAFACGVKGWAKAGLGSWIVLAERDHNGKILTMRCAVVDGETLKPGTFYTLKNGEFVEPKE